MYAIVDIAGQQIKVEKGQEVFVHRLTGEEGSKVEFNEILLIDNDGKISLGAPVITGARVSAKIISHVKGDKVLVFKKKRRKGYQKLNGHRQQFSKILIEDIAEKVTAPKKAAPKKAEAKPKTETAKVVATPKVEKSTPKVESKPKVEAKPKAKAKPKAPAKAKPKAKKNPAAETKAKAAPKIETKVKEKSKVKKEENSKVDNK